ncbi:Floculation protein FLO1 [Madurella fahalii]|uniref:Floculation protein FLO1 n=1 Tax=Madurella fahalii TaxID=1157608 RepID=A0ABQ0GDP0_9PEZI
MLTQKTLAPLGAIFISAATALNAGLSTTTTTIPYFGTCTTSTTLTPCGTGHVTVVIQTPITEPVCTTTPTATATSTTSTPTASPTPGGPCLLVNPLCRPAGLNIDYYTNPLGGYSSGTPPSSYYITEDLSPLDSSLTNVTFFPQNQGPSGLPVVFPPNPTLPNAPYHVGWTRDTNGGVTVDANNFTLVYQGFYRARRTGVHAICSTADNENDVFFGHGNAFSCLNGRPSPDAAPLLVSTGGFFQNGLVCRNVDLIAGLYYPVRNVMGNWQGPSAFNFTIQEPGVAFESRTNDFTGNAYPHQCGIFL